MREVRRPASAPRRGTPHRGFRETFAVLAACGTGSRGRSVRALSLAVLAALAGACDSGPEGDRTAVPARTYSVRGAVRGTEGELVLQHEAIPGFVGPGGAVEPMGAMTMSFPVAPEVDLTGLAPGDPVEIRLRVDWSAAPAVLVTSVEALPAGTELELARGG